MRFKYILLGLAETGTSVRIVVGVDLGGTSREVLRELTTWTGVEAFVYRNRRPGHTFHPKISYLEWQSSATIYVGSHNLTEGGFFRNYEAGSGTTYTLPQEAELLQTARTELNRFLEPVLPLGLRLNAALYTELAQRSDIPGEAEVQERRRRAMGVSTPPATDAPPRSDLFGTETIEPPPPLPADLLEALSAAVNQRRRQRARATETPTSAPAPIPAPTSPIQIAPASFYMTLPTLQGENIPGEARIPLAAIEMAEDFWGWPERYQQDDSPRGGESRVYHNWVARWLISDAAVPAQSVIQNVRMYMYENSSDFRFYARPLVNAGGDLGDIVRITRVDSPTHDFDCILARQGTPTYEGWLPFCSTNVRNSSRRFGYG